MPFGGERESYCCYFVLLYGVLLRIVLSQSVSQFVRTNERNGNETETKRRGAGKREREREERVGVADAQL